MRRRPTRTWTFDPTQVTQGERDRLAGRLFPLYAGLFHTDGCASSTTRLLFASGVLSRTTVCYDGDREIGFANAHVRHIETARGRIAVMRGSAIVDLGYRCTYEVSLVFARAALLHLARFPRMPFWGLSIASSPAVYSYLVSRIRELYPTRLHTPPWATDLCVEIAAAMELETAPGNPWVLRHSPFALVNPERLRRSTRLMADPDAQFFWRQVDAHGPDSALLVVGPVNPRNVATGIHRSMRALLLGERRPATTAGRTTARGPRAARRG